MHRLKHCMIVLFIWNLKSITIWLNHAISLIKFAFTYYLRRRKQCDMFDLVPSWNAMISIPLCHDCYVFVAICLLFTFLPCVIVLKLELETRNEVINNILYIVLLQGIIYYLKHAFVKIVLRQSISIVIWLDILKNDCYLILNPFKWCTLHNR